MYSFMSFVLFFFVSNCITSTFRIDSDFSFLTIDRPKTATMFAGFFFYDAFQIKKTSRKEIDLFQRRFIYVLYFIFIYWRKLGWQLGTRQLNVDIDLLCSFNYPSAHKSASVLILVAIALITSKNKMNFPQKMLFTKTKCDHCVWIDCYVNKIKNNLQQETVHRIPNEELTQWVWLRSRLETILLWTLWSGRWRRRRNPFSFRVIKYNLVVHSQQIKYINNCAFEAMRTSKHCSYFIGGFHRGFWLFKLTSVVFCVCARKVLVLLPFYLSSFCFSTSEIRYSEIGRKPMR